MARRHFACCGRTLLSPLCEGFDAQNHDTLYTWDTHLRFCRHFDTETDGQ